MRHGQFAREAGGRRGVSLAELVVALVILTLGLSGLHALLSASDGATGRVQTRMKAAEVARRSAMEFALLPWKVLKEKVADTSEATRSIGLQAPQMAGTAEYATVVLLWQAKDGGIQIEGRAWLIPPADATTTDTTSVDPPEGVIAETASLVIYPPGAAITAAASPAARTPAPAAIEGGTGG